MAQNQYLVRSYLLVFCLALPLMLGKDSHLQFTATATLSLLWHLEKWSSTAAPFLSLLTVIQAMLSSFPSVAIPHDSVEKMEWVSPKTT